MPGLRTANTFKVLSYVPSRFVILPAAEKEKKLSEI